MVDPEPSKVNVVFSYSHADSSWVQRFAVMLQPLARQDLLRLLIDVDTLRPGDSWQETLPAMIRSADIAVMLISADYLASEYIISQELPLLLRRQRAGRMILAPILISGALWTTEPSLVGLQFLRDPNEPLDLLSGARRDQAIREIALQLVELAGEIRNRRSSAIDTADEQSLPRDGSGTAELFISHSHEDGDFAELLKLRLQAEKLDAWIDIDRLAPGVNWQQEIDAAIAAAPAVIAILSPDARKSEYVTYEWSYALGVGRPIVPLMLRQTQLHPRLAAIQYLDFTLRSGRPWDKLIATLRAV